jgi:GR25 family glycosyltransferase involved in LPS biosynthesis
MNQLTTLTKNNRDEWWKRTLQMIVNMRQSKLKLIVNQTAFDIDLDALPWTHIREAVESVVLSEISESFKTNPLSFTCSWATDAYITELFTKLFSRQFLSDPMTFGWTIVVNSVPLLEEHKSSTRTSIDPNKTIVLRMEPTCDTSDTHWDKWIQNCPKSNFAFWGDHKYYLNTVEWHMPLTLEDLLQKDWQKTRLSLTEDFAVSAVCSAQDFMEGHQWRLAFLRKWYTRLHSSKITTMPHLHLWGKDGDLGMPDVYRGELPEHDKTLAFSSYRYTFACENCVKPNYVTEKLWDALVSETLCFYRGADVIALISEPNAVIPLPNDHEQALDTIMNVVQSDKFATVHLPAIQRTKVAILSRWSLQNRVRNVIRWFNAHPKVYVINLSSRPDRYATFTQRAQEVGLFHCERFEATEGLQRNDWRLFIDDSQETCIFRTGEIGCISSHCRLWQQVVQTNRPALIFEDDVQFTPLFMDRLLHAFDQLTEQENWEWASIGWYMTPTLNGHKPETNINRGEWWNVKAMFQDKITSTEHQSGFGSFGGGAFGYFLSVQGAQNLLSRKCQMPLDYHMMQMVREGVVSEHGAFAYSAPLVNADMVQVHTGLDSVPVDTNIQLTDRVLLGKQHEQYQTAFTSIPRLSPAIE